MSIVQFHPWVSSGRVFARLFGDLEQPSVNHQWAPRVDIKEEEKRFVILADIPGVDPKDIEVSTDKNVLTIKGERKSEASEDNGQLKRVERSYGAFLRSFTLPESADADGIAASGKHGVLEISIPKKTETTPRKIAVTH